MPDEHMPRTKIGYDDEARRHAHDNPEEYPEELRAGLKFALEYVLMRKSDNYDNPAWEPVVGFLEAAIDGTYPGG